MLRIAKVNDGAGEIQLRLSGRMTRAAGKTFFRKVKRRVGKAFGERFDDTIVRIQPARIISLGINSGEPATSARSVSAT